MDHEDRLDEVGSRQLVLTDELPQGSRAPSTTRPVGRREGHLRRLEGGGTARNLKWRPQGPRWHVLCLLLTQNPFPGFHVLIEEALP
jgi:hypothetical protein